MTQRTCQNCHHSFESDNGTRGQWQRFCSDQCRDDCSRAHREEHRPLCNVGGCSNTARNKSGGMCSTHVSRLWRSGSLDVTRVQRASRGTCIYPDCNAQDCGPHGYCQMHHTRITRHGDPAVRLATGPAAGPTHPLWKGDSITVKAAHNRVRRERGRASEHRCVDCGNPAAHWSYDHQDLDEQQSDYGPYSADTSHYQARCVSCHKTFDLATIDKRRKVQFE